VLARQLAQVSDRHERARPLGGDEAQQDRADERLLGLTDLADHAVGVAGECARDAAHRGVARCGQLLACGIALLPQLGRRELEQR
jgi:hypothetical protein